MKYFDDLPKRHTNHITESKAENAFQQIISSSECFMIQQTDKHDYGTDYQIEVTDGEYATNIRIHIQLKGTKKALNKDGSISIDINRSNLNYLISQAYSFFVCYHIPTNTLKFCSADAVLHQYAHSEHQWMKQRTITVNFKENLTISKLKTLAKFVKVNSDSLRNSKIKQITTSSNELINIIRTAPDDFYIPVELERAETLLSKLYNNSEDQKISDAFDRFLALFPADHNAIIYCYMAEINISINSKIRNIDRIKNGISYLESKLNTNQFSKESLLYSIGNGYSALGLYQNAINAYKDSIKRLNNSNNQLLAMCYKNLGTSYENIGNQQEALICFEQSLIYNNQLPEAHFALGIFHLKNGEYEVALKHFDEIVFDESPPEKQLSVLGWRINTLFNLKEGRTAFREINTLVSSATNNWVWSWCTQQVVIFGRNSIDNAKLSITFWNRYLKKKPNCSIGNREWLHNQLYLRSEYQNIDFTFQNFKNYFETMIPHIRDQDAAFLWDKLGHWAQDNEDWNEAEYCFRTAYKLAKGEYGYCLGTALLFLDRPAESLPLLLEQAEKIQPDEQSWYQVASAYNKLGKAEEAIIAYKKAISLNSNYDLAWFNLGGIYWNQGNPEKANEIWKQAIEKFPDHELTALLYRNLPDAFN